MAKRKNQQTDQLEIDLDTRIADLWQAMGEIEEWNEDAIGSFMRAAYGRGYCDALKEVKEGKPEQLLIENGYRRFL